MKLNTRTLVLCSLFTALTAILSQIALPIMFTPVPISLSTLSFLIAGALLGSKAGALSQLIYLLLGAVGLPVFVGMSGGIGIITGPTGGYIFGYIAGAFLIGLILERYNDRFIFYPASMTLGMILCYAIGTVWFMFVTDSNFTTAFAMCILPFIPGDAFKIAVGAVLSKKLSAILKKSTNYNIA